VFLPVLHRVGERGGEELCGVRRHVADAERPSQSRRHHPGQFLEKHAERRREHGLSVFTERGPLVVDGVQVQSESARTDDVGRVLAEHVADFHLATAGRQVRGHIAHQLLAALGHLAAHVPQLAGGEHGAQLLPHDLPLGAFHVEQTVGQRVLVRAGRVHAVVGEVRKVTDQHSVH